MILDYYLNMEESEKNLDLLELRASVNFLHSFYFCYPQNNSEEFLKITKNFILTHLDHFNKLQLVKMVDIFKYSEKFSN